MLYLEHDILNDFNLSIKQNSIPLELVAIQTYFYFILLHSLIYNTISIYNYEEFRHKKEVKQSLTFNYYTDTFDSVEYDEYNDEQEDVEQENLESLTEKQSRYINILKDLIQPNSLNREAILYYIYNLSFTKYDLLKVYENYLDMLNFYDGKENFNLDMNIEPDIVLIINTPNEKLHIITNKAHLNFVDWIITHGIYDYVINDKKYRYQLLSQMSEIGFLKGNLFIQFQLEEIPEINTDIIESSDDNEDVDYNNLDNSVFSNDSNSDDETLLDIEKLNHYYIFKQFKKTIINIYNKIIEYL